MGRRRRGGGRGDGAAGYVMQRGQPERQLVLVVWRGLVVVGPAVPVARQELWAVRLARHEHPDRHPDISEILVVVDNREVRIVVSLWTQPSDASTNLARSNRPRSRRRHATGEGAGRLASGPEQNRSALSGRFVCLVYPYVCWDWGHMQKDLRPSVP